MSVHYFFDWIFSPWICIPAVPVRLGGEKTCYHLFSDTSSCAAHIGNPVQILPIISTLNQIKNK